MAARRYRRADDRQLFYLGSDQHRVVVRKGSDRDPFRAQPGRSFAAERTCAEQHERCCATSKNRTRQLALSYLMLSRLALE
jgi:hypothetical protein